MTDYLASKSSRKWYAGCTEYDVGDVPKMAVDATAAVSVEALVSDVIEFGNSLQSGFDFYAYCKDALHNFYSDCKNKIIRGLQLMLEFSTRFYREDVGNY